MDPLAASATAPAHALAAIADQVSAPKARLAWRLLLTGRQPSAVEFHRAGLTLSDREVAAIADWIANGLATRVLERHVAADGTVKLRVGLADGRFVETVAMPAGTVCVSTQVGCAVGCRFCASGLFGVERNLTPDEILEQVVHARRAMAIDRVVFMGMGEPTHNLDAVLEAVRRIKLEARISPRRQTVSTVGSTKAIARMAAATERPCLAISLHLADDARRRELMPNAHRDPVRDIVAAADDYGRAIRAPVQFEYTLLRDINDGDADIDALCDLLAGVRGHANFIVYNRVEGLPFAAPLRDRIVEIVRRVKQRGLLATIRDSSGADANAACGQLRLRPFGSANAE